MPTWFTKLSIRTRLLIILLTVTTMAMLVFALALLSQFRARAVYLTEEILRSEINTVLSVVTYSLGSEEIRVLEAGANMESADYEHIRMLLINAAELLRRSEALVFIAAPGDSPGEMHVLVSSEQETVEAVWTVGSFSMSEAVEAAFSGETAIAVDTIFMDEFGAWTSGFAPVRDANGEEIGIVGVDIRADWVFDVRDEVLRTTAFAFAILYPLIIAAIFWISGRITRPLQKMIMAAETVEKGEPFKPDTVADIQNYSDELGLMARVFSRMAVEVQTREAALKQQVKALEIQIDQTKRNKQVEEITESEFFRDLQRKKEQLRASTGEKKSESNQL